MEKSVKLHGNKYLDITTAKKYAVPDVQRYKIMIELKANSCDIMISHFMNCLIKPTAVSFE